MPAARPDHPDSINHIHVDQGRAGVLQCKDSVFARIYH
jgi:hypothetical protein